MQIALDNRHSALAAAYHTGEMSDDIRKETMGKVHRVKRLTLAGHGHASDGSGGGAAGATDKPDADHSAAHSQADSEKAHLMLVEAYCISTLAYVNSTIVLYHGIIPNRDLQLYVQHIWEPTPW